MTFEPPGYCPNCGEYVEEGTVVCECCGSCSDTGWNDDSVYDGLDLPGEEGEGERRQSRVLGVVVSLGLLALLIYVFVFR